jgi:acylpyruvate hydrolase
MKIICIGRNYMEHAKELDNPIPRQPVFFMKPDTSVIKNNQPFFHPDFSENIHYETEIVVKINRLGKYIDRKFAYRYYKEIGIGIDFTARDLQDHCKVKGLPWEIAKSFDGAAPIGTFIDKSKFPDLNNIHFGLSLNGKKVQEGNTRDMIFKIDEIISYVSQFITLKIGDLIFTGTPEGVGKISREDHLQASIEGEVLLDFIIK